jgi:hypothetical protein
MERNTICPECGTAWQDDLTCQEHFHQLLAWEAEYPDKTYAVHHLLVLCYHLQHPHLYSPQGLQGAKKLLAEFVDQGITPGEARRRQRAVVDSGNRAWKITGTPTFYGAYAHPIQWPMTVVDVTAAGVDAYLDTVKAWARSMNEALKASGNEA